jgi:hypothetical protein
MISNFRLILFTLFILIFSCQNNPNKNTLTTSVQNEKADQQWVSLSPLNSLDGWHMYQDKAGQKTGWSVNDGVFTYNSDIAKGNGNKSLISDETYTSFEIKFEWKLSPNSNSGFMWGVFEGNEFDAPYLTGPEIQIIDAEIYGDDKKNQIRTTGSLYDMFAPDHVMAKPAGEWNSYHITINQEKNKGSVIHNGMEINRFPLHGPEWDALVAKSKFSEMSGFGKYKEGHLCLQDHPGVISYKNIQIKRL